MVDQKERQEWLVKRQSGIGGSDAPVVMGVSHWKTRTELWAEKAGLAPASTVETRAMRMGTILEPVIADEYAERHPDETVIYPGPHEIQYHPDYSQIYSTLDRVVDRGGCRGVLEIKTTSERMAGHWESEPPIAVQVQVQHQLLVTGFDYGVVAVLIGGNEYKEFEVARNDHFIDYLLNDELSFWEHVLLKTPPHEDASPALAAAIQRLHPDDSGETVILPDELIEVTRQLEELEHEAKVIENQQKELKARIQCAIGQATYGQLPDGTVWSWKTQSLPERTMKATKYRVLRKKGGVK